MPVTINGTTGVAGVDGSAGTPSYQGNDSNTGIFFPAADTIAFAEGGAEVARFDSSGNFGIGTSTPANKLNVFGSDATIRTESTSEDKGLLLIKSGVQGFAVTVNGAAQRLDFSSANAWPSISQIMSLTAAGNVGIGTSSPGSNRLYITAPDGTAPLTLNSAGGSDATRALNFNVAGDNYGKILVPSGSGGAMAFWTGGANAATERMRIDSSGNVGIGTSSPNASLSIGKTTTLLSGTGNTYGVYIYPTSSGECFVDALTSGTSYADISFRSYNNGTYHRMRFDGSGNLLVGTTSNISGQSSSIQVANSNSHQIVVRNTGASAGSWWRMAVDSSNTFYVLNQSTTGVGIASGATSWSAISDERLKTAVTPFENAAAKVASLRTGTGRYLTDDEGVSRSFLIAQDVKAVLPEAVDVGSDERGTLSLRYTDIIPLLIAAIQEQQAMIQQLQAEVAALKGAQA